MTMLLQIYHLQADDVMITSLTMTSSLTITLTQMVQSFGISLQVTINRIFLIMDVHFPQSIQKWQVLLRVLQETGGNILTHSLGYGYTFCDFSAIIRTRSKSYMPKATLYNWLTSTRNNKCFRASSTVTSLTVVPTAVEQRWMLHLLHQYYKVTSDHGSPCNSLIFVRTASNSGLVFFTRTVMVESKCV